MRRVVMFSGGISSWATARRIVDQEDSDDVVLLFADTSQEDEDLYRFVDDCERNLGVPLIRLADGRDPWQVFFDVRFLGNTRVDPCSRILKRELCRKWLEAERDPADTIVSLGFTYDEGHRLERALPYWAPWTVDAPLIDPPVFKADLFGWLEREGIAAPRLYQMGFQHNNCGGFCIKGGQQPFKLLLEKMPERYAYHENKEQELREFLGKDVAILRDRRGGETKPMTLKAFRERLEGGGQAEMFDYGACSCFSPVDDVINDS